MVIPGLNCGKNKKIIYKNFNQLSKLSKDKFNIIITLQPSLGGLPIIIKDIIENYSDLKLFFWIRLHPRQLNSKIHKTLISMYSNYHNINIHEASSYPLPILMSKMDLHLTGFSSSVYEALYFNVRTILFDKNGLDYFSDMIVDKSVKYFTKIEDIKDYINFCYNKKVYRQISKKNIQY